MDDSPLAGESTRRFVRARASSLLPRSSFTLAPTSYSCFICNVREEAGSASRLLQLKLSAKLSAPCFLDCTDADDIRKLLTVGVLGSKSLAFVQTRSCLTSPPCLLELYAAFRNGTPVIPIVLVGGGYDFDEARALLADLEARLEAANPDALELLKTLLAGDVLPEAAGCPPPSIEDMSRVLSTSLPYLISGMFDAASSEAQMDATITDVVFKIQRALHPAKKEMPVSVHDETQQETETSLAASEVDVRATDELPDEAWDEETGEKVPVDGGSESLWSVSAGSMAAKVDPI